MDTIQYSDEQLYDTFFVKKRIDFFLLVPVAVGIVCATKELCNGVPNASTELLSSTLRSILSECARAVWVLLHLFCEFVL